MNAKRKAIAIVVVIYITLLCVSASAQVYVSSNVTTSFFSSTPIEDIKAASRKTSAVVIAKNKSFAFQVPIASFEFEKKMMQEHFNENYLESQKYPNATFKGNIESEISWSINGNYNVVAKGILNIHGVSKNRSIPVKITVKDGSLFISAAFDVACVDHDIQIPTLVFTKIAKVIAVKVDGILAPKP